MLYNKEAALAWDFTEIGKVKAEFAPFQKIWTAKHKVWLVSCFHILQTLASTVIDILQDPLKKSIIKSFHGPYRNSCDLDKKNTPGKYWLVILAIELNRVTIWDAKLLSSKDEFSEEIAGCAFASFLAFFSGYDQVDLDKKSRDHNRFMTPLGLIWMTTLS